VCGIAGIYRPHDSRELTADVAAMLNRIEHRGPDGRGTYVSGPIGLGHVRLAILDLTDCAAQPMVSHDKRYTISFNGEIYNFHALRDELAAKGINVRSTGDTEVLLEYLAAFGIERTLPRLEGDWAFALWDAVDGQVTLARDHHGVKPLYYTVDGSTEIRFGSEIKAILGGNPQPEHAVMNAAMLGLSTTWGSRTIFRGLHAVRPGEWVTVGSDLRPMCRSYFSFDELVDEQMHRELVASSPAAVVERVTAAFDASLRSRMISDVEVGSLVSGGVDSSLITAASSAIAGPLHLFHADVVRDSERSAAQALADSLETPLYTTRVSDDDFLDNVATVTLHNEIPLIYHLNSVPFFCVSRLAREHGIKVLLTGEGSDEYFIGYPQYALAPVLDLVNGTKRQLQNTLYKLSPKAAALLWQRDADSEVGQLRSLLFGYEEETVSDRSRRPLAHLRSRSEQRAHQLSLTLAQEHLVSLLHRNDRLGMAWGIESRFPFLGHDFTKLAINLPARYKLHWTRHMYDRRHPFITDKWVVREMARRMVPQSLSDRTKRGFPVSISSRIDVSPKLFDSGFVATEYALDSAALAELVARGSGLWLTRLMLLEVWGQLFFGGRSAEELQVRLKRHVSVSG
jgi:asparagine synthase (glutamine-hydrolysing)